MRYRVWLAVALLICVGSAAMAQEGQPRAAKARALEAQAAPNEKDQMMALLPEEIQQRVRIFKQAGMNDDEALMLGIVTTGEVDPSMLMMLAMTMDEPRRMDDIMGIMLLSGRMGPGAKEPEPGWFQRGNSIVVIDDGVVYKVDKGTLEIQEKIELRRKFDQNKLMQALMVPAINKAREKATQTSCLSNLKQMALGVMMFVQDHDNNFMTENWVEEIFPYTKNKQILVCPSRPELPVGYAFNDKLLGANMEDIKQPSQVILFFESNAGGKSPVGNAADVPPAGVHDGAVNCAFADGHAKLLQVNEARTTLQRPVFE